MTISDCNEFDPVRLRNDTHAQTKKRAFSQLKNAIITESFF